MILQALYEYYQRKPELPAPGFEKREIPFVIVIDEQGRFIDLQDTREPKGKKLVAKSFLVPKEQERSGSNAWQKTNVLWDHYGYVLSHPKPNSAKDVEMARKQHQTFVNQIKTLSDAFPYDVEIKAVLYFLVGGHKEVVFQHPLWEKCSDISGCNLTFRLRGRDQLVCQNDEVQEFTSATYTEDEEEEDNSGANIHDICLITGEVTEIARIHPRTPIQGSKSNAKLVSFQKNMGFDSYGKQQSYNAPVGKKATFAYTTALNHLLAKDSRQRMQMGDASTVFWAEKPGHPMESQFGDLFSEPPKDDPDRNTEAVKSLYRSPETGASMFDNDGTRFYVLGLAPNAARIAVRFWHTASISDLAAQFRQHFEDIAIAHAPHEPETLSLFRLAVSTAVQSKSENIPLNLMGDFMKSILTGLPYPQTLLQAAIRRSRAEQAVTYPRAALIKACINRLTRSANPVYQEELKVSLDPSNTNAGYRLGRLFAALEKIQEDANHGINATIRDRFYGAASSTPVTVFTTLLRLKNHHISKLKGEKPGLAVKHEKLIGEIMEEGLDGNVGFSTTLSLADQGRFAIGYYHQRQAFFTKSDQSEDEGI